MEAISVGFSFGKICEFCKKYEEKKDSPFYTSHPEVAKVKDHLQNLSQAIKQRFKSYDFSVEFSQGVGTMPKVPYICILPPGQSVSNGIYVAICFGRSGNGAVAGMAESVSNRKGLRTIDRARTNNFIDVNGKRPETKYNNAFENPRDFYVVSFNDDEFFAHLQMSLRDCYERLALSDPSFNIVKFTDSLITSGILLKASLYYRFIFSLLTKPFVILTGLAGSGKTKLAEAFSLWISENSSQYCMISVGADWTNREPLLGYPNALAQGEYIKPDCGALELILRANKDPSRPYFLILDEMNMSHVERYFADFLSAMESTDSIISLHPDGDGWEKCDVPATIALPKNLFIIGTVNIDETTYMFSPKVLDRANVIEFRVEKDDMEKFFDAPTTLDMEALRGAGSAMGKSFVSMAQAHAQPVLDLKDVLMPFFEKLQDAGAEFGYRTAAEISRFVAIYRELNNDSKGSVDDSKPVTDNSIIDAAIMQKLLPKLHGSRHKIEPVLRELAQLCLNNPSTEPFGSQRGEIRYPLSYMKLERMHKRVIADGFTSYAEA